MYYATKIQQFSHLSTILIQNNPKKKNKITISQEQTFSLFTIFAEKCTLTTINNKFIVFSRYQSKFL